MIFWVIPEANPRPVLSGLFLLHMPLKGVIRSFVAFRSAFIPTDLVLSTGCLK